MTRAVALADQRIGWTAPNPSVACIIVREGRVVAEAVTGVGGRPHAEETALTLAGPAARGAVAFVTLEPCASRSTGSASCSHLLIAAGVERVVVAARDPHPNAAGAGLAALRAAGVQVEIGLMAAEAERVNAGFLRVLRDGVPVVEIAADPWRYDRTLRGAPPADLDGFLRALARAGVTRARVAPDDPAAEAWRAAGVRAADEA